MPRCAGTAASGKTSNIVMRGTRIVAAATAMKSADRVKRGADRRSERKCGKHRHPNPCDDSSCVPGAGKGKSPVHRAGDDKALRSAEQRTAEQQYRDG